MCNHRSASRKRSFICYCLGFPQCAGLAFSLSLALSLSSNWAQFTGVISPMSQRLFRAISSKKKKKEKTFYSNFYFISRFIFEVFFLHLNMWWSWQTKEVQRGSSEGSPVRKSTVWIYSVHRLLCCKVSPPFRHRNCGEKTKKKIAPPLPTPFTGVSKRHSTHPSAPPLHPTDNCCLCYRSALKKVDNKTGDATRLASAVVV